MEGTGRRHGGDTLWRYKKKNIMNFILAALCGRRRSSPEGEGDDGARLSLAHGDGNALVLVHQVVFIWLAVNRENTP